MGGTVGKIIGGVFGVANADKELGRIRDETAQAKYDLEAARSKRQEIINPYAGITDLSGLAQDLSSQITNPLIILRFLQLQQKCKQKKQI